MTVLIVLILIISYPGPWEGLISVLSSLSPSRALLPGFLHLTCWLRTYEDNQIQAPLRRSQQPSSTRDPPFPAYPPLGMLAPAWSSVPRLHPHTCLPCPHLYPLQILPLFKMQNPTLRCFKQAAGMQWESTGHGVTGPSFPALRPLPGHVTLGRELIFSELQC